MMCDTVCGDGDGKSVDIVCNGGGGGSEVCAQRGVRTQCAAVVVLRV